MVTWELKPEKYKNYVIRFWKFAMANTKDGYGVKGEIYLGNQKLSYNLSSTKTDAAKRCKEEIDSWIREEQMGRMKYKQEKGNLIEMGLTEDEAERYM